MFVPPNWFEGLITQIGIFVVIPLILALIAGIMAGKFDHDEGTGATVFEIAFVIGMILMIPIGSAYWWSNYEVPSIQYKNITVKEWQPKPGISTDSNGMMTITSANDLLLVTTDGEGFLNEENLFFGKFNTRDIFNQLKVNGTYEIEYFGWRNGFNNGFPTILKVTRVINENGTHENRYSDYFGTKLATQGSAVA